MTMALTLDEFLPHFQLRPRSAHLPLERGHGVLLLGKGGPRVLKRSVLLC